MPNIAVLLFCLIFATVTPALAAESHIDILIPNQNYLQAAKKIRVSLARNQAIQIYTRSQINNNRFAEKKQSKTVLISLGKHSEKNNQIYKKYDLVISSFVEHQENPNDNAKNNISIVNEQPVERQIKLINKLLPYINKIGVLVKNHEEEEKLKALFPKHSVNIEFEVIGENTLIKSLNKLLSNSDVILATKNKEIYNNKTIRSILLTAYRKNKAVVGIGKNYVKAGFLASTYSDVTDYGKQISEIITQFEQGQTITPKQQYPRYFSVAINKEVARSLGYITPTEEEITKGLNDE